MRPRGYYGFESKEAYEEHYSDERNYADEIPAMEAYAKEADAECATQPRPVTRIVVPAPPSTNNLFITVKGRRVRAPSYRQWTHDAGWRLKLQHPEPVAGPARVHITAGLGRRRDLDNAIKALLDLLVLHRVIEDDSLVDDLRIVRGGEAGEAVIEVWAI